VKTERLKAFALGFAVFSATEAGWLLLRGLGGASSRWVMEPNSGIVATVLIHFVAALLFSVVLRPAVPSYFIFTAGVATAVAVTLFLVGPGNLWPIVLVIDGVFLTPALAGGFAVGSFLLRRRRAAA
jgi:hypothetical protein